MQNIPWNTIVLIVAMLLYGTLTVTGKAIPSWLLPLVLGGQTAQAFLPSVLPKKKEEVSVDQG